MVASWFRYIQDIKTVQLAVSMHAVAEGHRIEVKVGVSDVSFHVRPEHYGEENPSHLKYISHVISFQKYHSIITRSTKHEEQPTKMQKHCRFRYHREYSFIRGL